MPSIAAVVLNYRRWPETLEVISSLEAQTSRVDQLLVVDNASGADEVAAIEAESSGRFALVALNVNSGYAAGMNEGIRVALSQAADAVLMLTHDVVLDRRCVEFLVDELERNPCAGVVAPVLAWKGREDTTWSAGGKLGRLTGTPHHPDKGRSLAAALREPTRTVTWADGAALLVRRQVLDELGPLPEQYFLYFEEVDFQARVRRSGRDVRVVSGALAWQSPGHTPRYLAARNQMLWLRSGRRRAIPFFLAGVSWTCGREIVRRLVGRAPDLNLVRALLIGVIDGVSGRLRKDFFALA